MPPRLPSPPARRPTLKDVAAACGLSHVAVSLALRGSPEIPPATRERVQKAAQRLQYVPNASARQMKGGRPGRLAYVASRLAHGFVGQVLVGLEERAHETGRYFNAIQPYSTWFRVQAKDEVLRQILHGQEADAVVLVSCRPSPALIRDYVRHQVPLVLVEDQAPGCHSVRVDNVAGAREGMAHLLAVGCRRIGLISGIVRGEGLDLNPTVAERRKGYSLALKAAGLATRPELLVESGFYDKADGRRSLDQLLAAEPRLDAVFCAAGDNVALGVLERAQELGLSVPGRLKVLGFDDIEAAALVRPALSTLRQPIQALGAQAFDLAVAAVDGRLNKPSEIVFKSTLVLRKSA